MIIIKGGIRVILYKRVFRFHAKNGTKKQVRAEKHVPVFPSQEIVTNFEKQGAVFPLHKKNGNAKNRTKFSKMSSSPKIFI